MRELDIALPGLRLAALGWGADTAPPLLALHGWLDNAASFAGLGPLLAAQRRVIALDLPGHGRSAHLPDGPGMHYHFVDQAEVVLAAAEALALERFDLLGHSMGAGIASLVAAAAPDRIGRLLLIEGLGPLADDPAQTLERFRRAQYRRVRSGRGRLRVFAGVEDAIEARASASDLPASLARPIVERGLVAVDGGFRWSSDPRLTLPTPVRMGEAQVRALLAGIEAPTRLLLARPQTPYLPESTMRQRAACVRDIGVRHLDGPHHLHLHDPHAALEALQTD